ncbi:MAG TPA: S8 family serine peptidase [Bacilli bacterium]|nr:S8 family serine peptidase [Bacilli bacterium]
MNKHYLLSEYEQSGHGIKIAHIDSGINEWHPHISKVNGGIAFHVHEDGRIEVKDDFSDQLGHGTAVAGVLSYHVPDAELWAVKIFDDTLQTYTEVLTGAIEWCVDQNIDVVNLSLGVCKHDDELEKVCKYASDKGVIMISSCDQRRGLVWPSKYETVFGVETGLQKNNELIYYTPHSPLISFRASGLPRNLEGPMQKFNLQGHSFASAHVTSFIVKIMAEFDINKKQDLEKVLLEIA